MKNYLCSGMGRNSIALHLLLLDQKIDFEPVFVNHQTDWPETYHYLAMFQWWLKNNGYKPITILNPKVKRSGVEFSSLYEFCKHRNIIPMRYPRWCTVDFKGSVLDAYCQSPAFKMLGIDAGEAKRAKIVSEKGFEYRYPLIENDIDLDGCIQIIKDHDLPVPTKSGCWICSFQKLSEWKRLRIERPELFCKAEQLENAYNSSRANRGKQPVYFNKSSLRKAIEEDQKVLFEKDEYPPCHCGL